jgi:hypothetical protein
MSTIAPLDRVLAKLTGVTGPNVNGWYAARCPAHHDRKASLGIKAGDTGAVILKCQAGCLPGAVVEALGMTMPDLFPASRDARQRGRQRGRIVAMYPYTDEQGALLFEVCRTDPKDFVQRQPDGHGGWTWNLKGVRRVLFHLPALLAADSATTVYVVEGEKDVLALEQLGMVATTNPGGAGKWRRDFAESLRGRQVVLLPDNDESGRTHMEQVATTLAGVAAAVRVVALDVPPKGDVSDWLAAGGTRAQLETLAAAGTTPSTAATSPRDRGPSQATQLVDLAAALDLWHDADGAGYADIRIDGHRETHALRSRPFRDYLARRYYLAHRRAVSAEALREALDVLGGRARWECPEHLVAVRVAGDDERIYVDLGDPQWRVVEIDGAGWRIIAEPPLRFRRPRGLLPLPEPTRGGSLEDLRPFLNLKTEDDWRLVGAWLVAALRPRGPYPVLLLHGEAGTAKSTTARILRDVIDPNRAALRTPPREERDIIIAASNSWIVALDNLSRISPWLNDGLCRLSTGGGYGARELYSDLDEVLVDVMRPVLLTAIEDVAVQGDLADRKIAPQLPVISEKKRQREVTISAAAARVRPTVLGALLDTVAGGLRALPSVQLDQMPRMADFATWVVACEPSLGWAAGTFMQAYDRDRRESAATTLESSQVGTAVLALLATRSTWDGTSTELLEALAGYVPETVRRDPKRWPQSARGLAGALRRLAPAFRAAGIETNHYRSGHEGGRRVAVTTVSTVSGDTQAGNSSKNTSPSGADGCADGRADGRSQPSAQPSARKPSPDAAADGADGADGRKPTLWESERSPAKRPPTPCPVCGLDARTSDAAGEAWCVACHLTREWGAQVVDREPGCDDDDPTPAWRGDT